MRHAVTAVLGLVLAVLLVAGAAAQEQDADGAGRGAPWYEQDGINTGLAAAPGDLDRTTPRAAMRGFLAAAREGDFARAAHVLNLSGIAPEEQAGRGPDLAEMLASVIERRVWVGWLDLPARPDAMIEGRGSSEPRAGEVRRDLRIAALGAEGTTYDIRLARYKDEGQPAVWLFTPQTVANVPALFEIYGPRRFEAYIPDAMKQPAGGLQIWEWLALPVFLGVLTLLGWGTVAVMAALSLRARRPWLRRSIRRTGMPLALIFVAIAAQILLSMAVSFSGSVTAFVRPALNILAVWGVGIALIRVIDAILARVTMRYVGEIDDRRGADERELYTFIYALRRLIVLLMVGFALIFVLVRLNLFDTVGATLLASAGILTVVFGIAGQQVLGNILASLQIAFAKPVRIGDSILFEGEWAYVESVYYTFMRLRTWDHRRIVVPVKYFISKPFENWSVGDPRMMRSIRLVVDHSADIGALRRAFRRFTEEDEGVTAPENSLAVTTGHSEAGIEVCFYAESPDPSTAWFAEARLRERLLDHIRRHHPEWWPRERIAGAHSGRGAAEDDG